MKLLTKELIEKLPPLYANEEVADPIALVKFFDPCGSWTWYATEYEPETRTFFGLVKGMEEELGYFTLDELESVKGPLGLGIERDLWFKPTPLSKLRGSRIEICPGFTIEKV